MDIDLLQSPVENNFKSNSKRKQKRRPKKVMENNGPQTIARMDGNSEGCKLVNNDLKKNLLETDLSVQSLAECLKDAVESTEKLSEVNAGSKKKKSRKKIKKAKIQDEIQNVNQAKLVTGSTKDLTEGNVNRKRKRKSKKKKAKNKDEIQSMEHVDGMLNLQSDANHGEGIDGKQCTAPESGLSVSKELSLSDLVHDKESPLDLCKDEKGGNVNGERKRKSKKKKAKNKDEIQSMEQVDGMLNLLLSDGNHGEGIIGTLTENKCTAQESGVSVRKESSLSDLEHDKENPLDLCKDEEGGNVNGERKRKSKKKKAQSKDEIQSMEQLHSSDGNHGEDIIGRPTENECTAQESGVSVGKESSLSGIMHDKENPLDLCKDEEAGNVNGERKRTSKKKKAIFKDETQRMEQLDLSDGNHGEGIVGTLTETECTAQESGVSVRKESSLSDLEHEKENPLDLCKDEEGRNVNGERKRKSKKKKAKNKDEIQSMKQLHSSDGNHGEEIICWLTENECTAQESGVSVGKESSLSDILHDKENPLDLCKDEEGGNVNGERKRKSRKKKKAKNKDETQSMEQLHLSDGNPGEGIDGKLTENECTAQESGESVRKESSLSHLMHDKETPEVDGKVIPCESQLSPHPSQMAVEKAKVENGLNEVNNGVFVNEGQCSAEGRTIFSTCDVEVTPHHSSPGVKEAEWLSKDLGQYPRIAPVPSIKRKLIVLDVNGLLANVVMPAPKDCRGDVHILGRAIFRRPFCDDFLKFCFQNFDVGVWSSRSKKIIDRVVDYLLGDLKDKLLFCWDMSHCTQTGFNTLENTYKPLVCKELRKIWESDDPNLPWKKGDYNETDTLLLDDSPYKALLNPLHTAIFPNSYHYKDKNDNSLGPGGDLRVYLEGLLTSENVQKYVEQHPFGQSAINETNLSWGFYARVLQTMSNRLQNYTPRCLPTLSYS